MDAIEIFARDAHRPWFSERTIRLFEPDNQARLIPGTDEIQIAISIDIEGLAVDEVMAWGRVEDNFFPIGSDEEPGLVPAVGDNVGSAVLRKIAGHSGQALGALVNDMFLPQTFCGAYRR